ncbi:MAG: DUF2946 domain-containing protein [Burkholderiaceae bacterium]|nr:DUF2946 domain-containing protein [Burkholderiaceae bacterium]
MQALRNAHLIARFVLVWFALSMGVAIASPILQPQTLELICSGTGAMKLLILTEDGDKPVGSHTLDCPLCANISAPPPVMHLHVPLVQPMGQALQTIPKARIAALTGAPLPARGPPVFS